MGIAEESTDKIISVTFQAASVTANLLLQVLQSLGAALKKENHDRNVFNTEQGQQVEVKTGKMNLHDLSGKGPTDYIDISNKREFKNIERQCKKHNIDYAVLKSKDSPPTYSIFFQTKDTNILKKMLGDAIKDIEKDLPEQEQAEQEQPEQEQPEQEQPEQEQPEQEQAEQEQPEQEQPEQEQAEQEQPEQEQPEQEQPEQEQPEQEQPEQEQAEQEQPEQEQHSDATDQPGANANEKNRETMGAEEQEKEEPIKKPETETSMPVQSNEAKAPTTDSVKREEQKDVDSRTEGDRQPVRKDEEKGAASASRESKSRAKDQATKEYPYPLDKLKGDLKNKKEQEKNSPIPQKEKIQHKQRNDLEM